MYFQVVEHFNKLRVVVIHNFAVSHIQNIDFFHLVFCQRKIPDVKILLHTIFMNRFGDNYYAALDIPPQGHLGGGFAVSTSNLRQNRVGEDTKLSFGKRTPRLGDYARNPT